MKSLDFEKSELKMGLRHAGRDLIFEVKLFLQGPPENFLCTLYVQGIEKVRLDWIFASVKKL